jgi:small GTP-binding protein
MNDDNEDSSTQLKVVLIGSLGVGNSCIVNRFTKNIFDKNCRTASGANYCKKDLEVNNQKISLDIWDKAGQKIFQSMGRHFYKNAIMIILVYDITNLKSFQDIQNYWYNDINEKGEKYKVIAFIIKI